MNIVASTELYISLQTYSIRTAWQLKTVESILVLHTTQGKNVADLQKMH